MTIITTQDHYHDLSNIFDHKDLLDFPKTGIVHVGADVGQEVTQYFRYGFEKVILIEANPNTCKILASKFGDNRNIRIFNYAICDKEGVIDFHIHTSRSGSTEPASILPMKRFKEIVKTLSTPATIQIPATTLDALFQRNGIHHSEYNFLNIDVQGAELLALKGAITTLATIDVVISEVNLLELYEGGVLEDEIVSFLALHKFQKRHAVYHTLYDETSTFPAWGECLFVKLPEARTP